MLTISGLIISIVLQIVATIVIISLIKVTRFNVSWILLSIGFIFMAIRRLIEFLPFMDVELSRFVISINNWLGILISVLIVVGVFYIKKIFKELQKAEEARLIMEKRVLNAVINTEESERKRFAKDLHDGLGPLLSSVKMSFSAVEVKDNNSDQKAILSSAKQAINEAISSLKEISNNLSPHILDNFGLASAIRSFTNKIDQTGKIKIEFRSNIQEKRYTGNTEVILYRAICELITNTLKHAKAKKILISLDEEDSKLKVLYQDDGRGFDYNQVLLNETGGMGLPNIRSRINSINGNFAVDSLPGEGVVVTIGVSV
jgi:signal transduction histidine kinase